jgi:hypothetical protein
MPLLCTCLAYVFVGLLVHPFVLCVAVLGVSAEAEVCCWRPAIEATRGESHLQSQNTRYNRILQYIIMNS